MTYKPLLVLAMMVAFALGACQTPQGPTAMITPERRMDLGNFSVSLSVKDLAASRAFYEKLDFRQIGGDASQNWLILRNGHATIGLFQGMFEGNILTFNPGWDREGNNVDSFTDVREIQRLLQQRGIELSAKADESSTGPAHITLIDPDGNAILIDQHR